MVAVLDRPRTRAVRVNRLRRYTADEVIDFPNDDRIWELVDGQMVEKHGTNRTVSVAFQMAVALGTYAGVHGGVVIPPEGFVRLFGSPQQLKRPDTGFVVTGRLPGDDLGDGYLDIPADVIVEVFSPRDVAETVELKVRAYLAAGVRVVWLVYPKAETVHVRSLGVSRVIEGDDVLASEDVLPGFAIRVSELLGAR